MKKTNKRRLAVMIESELDKSETILAVKDMGNKIQGMLEDVAKMRVDTLMPLTEKIKEQFSQEEGQRFQQEMDASLNALQESTTTAKTEIDDQVAILNGDAPMNQMGSMGMEPDMDMSDNMGMDQGMGDNMDDMFGAEDSMAGGDEPLGRMQKESFTRKLKMLETKMRRIKNR